MFQANANHRSLQTLTLAEIGAEWQKNQRDIAYYDRESAMNADSARRDERRETQIIIPRVHHCFQQLGASDEQRVEACFREMRGWVLDEIIAEEAKTGLRERQDFIRENRDALLRLDDNARATNGMLVMEQAKRLFSGINEVFDMNQAVPTLLAGSPLGKVETAWRSLSLPAEPMSTFQSAFVGGQSSSPIRLRLARTWLLSTRPGLQDISPDAQEESKAQLMDGLVFVRREHNADHGPAIGLIDRPSCHAGVNSRIALTWSAFELMKNRVGIDQALRTDVVWSKIDSALCASVAACVRQFPGHKDDLVDEMLGEDLREVATLSCYRNYLDYFFTIDPLHGDLVLKQSVYADICRDLLAANPNNDDLEVYLTGHMDTKIWIKQYLMPMILHPLTLPVLASKSQPLYAKLGEIAEDPNTLQAIPPVQVPVAHHPVQAAPLVAAPLQPEVEALRAALNVLGINAGNAGGEELLRLGQERVRAIEVGRIQIARADVANEDRMHLQLGIVQAMLEDAAARQPVVPRAQVQVPAVVPVVAQQDLAAALRNVQQEHDAAQAAAVIAEAQRQQLAEAARQRALLEQQQQAAAQIEQQREQQAVAEAARALLEQQQRAAAQVQFDAMFRAGEYPALNDAQQRERAIAAQGAPAVVPGLQHEHFLGLVAEELRQVDARLVPPARAVIAARQNRR